MILDKLQAIAEFGADKPFLLWRSVWQELKLPALLSLKKIAANLSSESSVSRDVLELIRLLEKDKPNEARLANALFRISNLFQGNTDSQEQNKINKYITTCAIFQKYAEMGEVHRLARVKLKENLSKEAQRAYDLKLFQNEGMMYCLEYYLAMYKAIVDAPNEEEKKKFIEQTEVPLGFGKVAGLWIDFTRDEVLDKFIYSILSNESRKNLIKAYFETKKEFMKISISLVEDKNVIEYQETNLANIIEAFKNLCQAFLDEYQRMGVDQLASFFFKPYGVKPFIRDIKL